MAREFYLYVCSRNSTAIFPKNTNVDFTTQLSDNIHLDGEWSCGLVECQLFGVPADPVFVCCDLVHESSVGEFKLPVLRRIRLKTTQFSEVAYMPLKTTDFNTIRIYVMKWNKRLPEKRSGHTYCTLHFQRRD